MAKIALITADHDLFEQTERIRREINLQNEVELYLAELSAAPQLAARLQHEDVDVLVARGGLATLIQNADVKIPVVEIVTTGQDLARICLEAKRITQLDRPRAAFIAFDNMVSDVDVIAQIANVDVTVHRLVVDEDISRVVDQVARLDYDVVFGGIKTTLLAKRRGLCTVPLYSGTLSIRNALLEAKKVALGRQIEKENAETFRALTEYSLEGVVSIDRQQRIQVINPVAAKLLGCVGKDQLGRPLGDLIRLPGIEQCLSEGQEIRGELFQRDATWFCFNIGPIIVKQAIIGAFVTFQEVSRIQETEATIRQEIVAKKFAAKYVISDIQGNSPQILEAKRIACEIAKTDATLLIHGESGTGKELFAQSIHNMSSRKSGPFVAINCAALPPNLLESELFGYVEGAFTGATKKGKAGLFEMAHRGTLFLDEISEMDKYGQSRLLRAIQERQIMRLGGDKTIPIDVRIIAASNQKLPLLIESGQFRQDLYYRLKVLMLNLPPLRQRSGDVVHLANDFLAQNQRHYKKTLSLTDCAYQELNRYVWPGNVRELSSFIERLVVTAGSSEINGNTIVRFLENREYDHDLAEDDAPPSLLYQSEEARLLATLQAHEYNLKKCAEALQISRPTLYRRLKKNNIHIEKTPQKAKAQTRA